MVSLAVQLGNNKFVMALAFQVENRLVAVLSFQLEERILVISLQLMAPFVPLWLDSHIWHPKQL